jgi:hypothetical protein
LSTPYDVVYEKFLKRLKNDSQFLNYKNVSEEEIEELVNEHLYNLLERAVDRLYDFGLPDIDFYNRNDEEKQFNEDLVPQEINLLADLMFLSYLDEDKNKLKAFEITFNSRELNVFSPANNRNSFLNMISNIENQIINNIHNYYIRDRQTWKIKSIYEG